MTDKDDEKDDPIDSEILAGKKFPTDAHIAEEKRIWHALRKHLYDK